MSYFNSKIFNKSTNLDLRVHHVGEEICDPGHMFGPVIRGSFMIHYIYSGFGTYYFEDDNNIMSMRAGVKLKEGQFFLIWPGVAHSYVADDAHPWHYTWVEFSGAKAEKLLFECGLTRKNLIFTPTSESGAKEVIRKYFKTLLDKQIIEDAAILGNLYLLFNEFIKISSSKVSNNNDFDIKKYTLKKL
ncbi:MAG: AraC family ligand binding domain-containing protein [Lachnospirales bacterium]